MNEINLYFDYSIIFHFSNFFNKRVERLHLCIAVRIRIDMDTVFPRDGPPPHFMTSWSFEKELHNRVTNVREKEKKECTSSNLRACYWKLFK